VILKFPVLLLLLKHYRHYQILGKVVGVVGTIVLATGGAPGVALAAPGGVGTTKNVVDVVQTIDQVHRLVAMAAAAISSVTACIIVKRLLDTLIRVDAKATKDKIAEVFPGALKNKQLVYRVREALRKYDYGSDSLLVTSLSPDTVNRALEKDFGHVFKENYNIGGLAGFPFGGVSRIAGFRQCAMMLLLLLLSYSS
jgi:Limiting CO2-inducible proteins B/C beta carbonyic anhydrases